MTDRNTEKTRASRLPRLLRIFLLLLLVVALPTGGYLTAGRYPVHLPDWVHWPDFSGWFASRSVHVERPPLVKVRRDSFLNRVGGRGSVESIVNTDIFCKVNGVSTLTYVIPEGTQVKKGDILAKIDQQKSFENLLTYTKLSLRVNTSLIRRRAALRSAEISLDEYVNGTFDQQWIKIENRLFDNQQTQKSAGDLLRHTQRLIKLGYTSNFQLDTRQANLENAKNNVQKAAFDQMVLLRHSSESQIAELVADIDTEQSMVTFFAMLVQFYQGYVDQFQQQYDFCTIYSPTSGEVVYANQLMRTRHSESNILKEGSSVMSGQLLFRIPDASQIQVRALINESDVSGLRPGMPASITFGVNSALKFEGEVIKVNQYPEFVWRSTAKNYLVNVQIVNPNLVRKQGIDLRTGISADVEIRTEKFENVLLVPIHSIVYWKDKTLCLEWENNNWKYVPVEVGPCDDEWIVIRNGLKEGEEVAPHADQYLSELALPEMINDETENTGESSKASDVADDSKDSGEKEKDGKDKDKEDSDAFYKQYEAERERKKQLYKPLQPLFAWSTMELCRKLDADNDKRITKEEVKATAPELLPFYDDWDRDRCGTWSLSDFVYAFYKARVVDKD